MKVRRSIRIDATPEEVYRVVMDPRRLKEWVSIHERLTASPGGQLDAGSKLTQRLGLTLSHTPTQAVAALVEQFGATPVEQLGHPRFYNIAWMELLESVRPAYQAMPHIFEPLDEA